MQTKQMRPREEQQKRAEKMRRKENEAIYFAIFRRRSRYFVH